MNRNEVVYLEIKMYSVLGVHYYGTLVCGHDKHEFIRTMTKEEVDRKNAMDSTFEYVYNMTTGGFDTIVELIAIARQEWRAIFPHAKVLIKGNHTYSEPQEILEASEEIKITGNYLWQLAVDIGFWDNNEEQMLAIQKEWDILLDIKH